MFKDRIFFIFCYRNKIYYIYKNYLQFIIKKLKIRLYKFDNKFIRINYKDYKFVI